MLDLVRRFASYGHIWPSLEYELAPHRPLLDGKVLNAGAGWRDVSPFVSGELVNQDIRWLKDERTNIDIYSPLHHIPVEDDFFDNPK